MIINQGNDIEGADEIETDKQQAKKVKIASEQAPQGNNISETPDQMDVEVASATQSLILSPSLTSRENQDVDRTDQKEMHSLLQQEDINYSKTDLPAVEIGAHRVQVTPPVPVVVKEETSEDEEQEDDGDEFSSTSSMEVSKVSKASGIAPSINPYAPLSSHSSRSEPAAKRQAFTKEVINLKDIKLAEQRRKDEIRKNKLVKQAANTKTNAEKLEVRFAAQDRVTKVDTADEITASLSQTSINSTPASPSVPIILPHEVLWGINYELAVGHFRVFIQVAITETNVEQLSTVLGELRETTKLEDCKTKIYNHVGSSLRFNVKITPASFNMRNTEGPQYDCGYRAEWQAYTHHYNKGNKTTAYIKDAGASKSPEIKKLIIDYFQDKATLKSYASSEAGKKDKQAMAILNQEGAKLMTTLQYTTDRLAVPTKVYGFPASLWARIGTSFELASATILLDEIVHLSTASQEVRKSVNAPTFPQLRRILQEGAIIAFTPSSPVESLEEIQSIGGLGHFSTQFPDKSDHPEAFENAIRFTADQIINTALLDPLLEHLRAKETKEAHNALDIRVPPIVYTAVSYLLVANIPQAIMDFSSDRGPELVQQARATAKDQILHLNEYFELGLDLAYLDQTIDSGPRVILTERVKRSKTGTTSDPVTVGLLFRLTPAAAEGWSPLVKECTGAARVTLPGERSQSTNIATVYHVTKIPNKLVPRVLSPKTAVCYVRVCAGNEVTNFIQGEAVRQYLWMHHQVKTIPVTYAVTHKRTIPGGSKEFLTEVVMMVFLEDEGVFQDARTTIRNEIFGSTPSNTSVIRSAGGINLELVPSKEFFANRPHAGDLGAYTLTCRHLRLIVSPQMTRTDVIAVALQTHPAHLTRGVFMIPYEDINQAYTEYVVTVSPTFTESQTDALRITLGEWWKPKPADRADLTEGTESLPLLEPAVDLHCFLDTMDSYAYYLIKPDQKASPQPQSTMSYSKAVSGGRLDTSIAESIYSSKTPSTTEQGPHSVVKGKAKGKKKSKLTDHYAVERSPASSLKSFNSTNATISSASVSVTSAQLAKIQNSVSKIARSAIREMVDDVKQGMLQEAASHKAELHLQAESIHEMQGTLTKAISITEARESERTRREQEDKRLAALRERTRAEADLARQAADAIALADLRNQLASQNDALNVLTQLNINFKLQEDQRAQAELAREQQRARDDHAREVRAEEERSLLAEERRLLHLRLDHHDQQSKAQTDILSSIAEGLKGTTYQQANQQPPK